MSDRMDHARLREIAADVAIGIADGQERDAVLRHTVTCADCRQLVSGYSAVVDEMLLLAPEEEPPLGFASRTLARIDRERPRRRRWVAPLAIAASFVLALLIGAGAVLQTTADDRRLADSYRGVLAQGNGAYFVASPLRSPTGEIGTLFGYEGDPPWLFATVSDAGPVPRPHDVTLVTRDGRSLDLGTTLIGGEHATWGGGVPVGLSEVAQLRFEPRDGGDPLVAYVDGRSPWDTNA